MLPDPDPRLFPLINELARDTPWLHPFMTGYADYGIAVFAGLLLAGCWIARRRADLTVLPDIVVLAQRGRDPSFPSDYAVLAGAVVAGLWPVSGRLGAVATVAAAVMAFAGVYMGADYPHDVLAGLILGAGLSTIGFRATRPILVRLLRRAEDIRPLRALLVAHTAELVEPVNTPEPTAPVRITARGRLLPLYAAGFVTAFGAHSIAASLGGYTHAQHASLLALGVLLAVYDGAEVVLKPVFGSLADRVGARPVLLGGLLAFAAASAAFVLAGDPAWVGLARFGQGAAAAAFSPAAGVLVARLTPNTGQGRGFGRYGAWKGLGYTLGPVLGGVLIAAGGYPLLFTTLARARRCRRRLGCPGGACCAAAAAHPADRGRSCPPTHQPRLRAADPGAGRRHRRPVGRGGVPARGGRRREGWGRWPPARSCRCWPRPPP